MSYELTKGFLEHATLSNPGDEASVRVTESGRKVGKYRSGDGSIKYSITEYPNGTRQETRTIKKRVN